MTRRSKDWNEGLSQSLKDPEFAKEFIVSLIEDEGLSLKDALAQTIRAYGIKEFSKVSSVAESNILRAISPDHNPTHKTLADLLKPFKLRVSVTDDHAA